MHMVRMFVALSAENKAFLIIGYSHLLLPDIRDLDDQPRIKELWSNSWRSYKLDITRIYPYLAKTHSWPSLEIIRTSA